MLRRRRATGQKGLAGRHAASTAAYLAIDAVALRADGSAHRRRATATRERRRDFVACHDVRARRSGAASRSGIVLAPMASTPDAARRREALACKPNKVGSLDGDEPRRPGKRNAAAPRRAEAWRDGGAGGGERHRRVGGDRLEERILAELERRGFPARSGPAIRKAIKASGARTHFCSGTLAPVNIRGRLTFPVVRNPATTGRYNS